MEDEPKTKRRATTKRSSTKTKSIAEQGVGRAIKKQKRRTYRTILSFDVGSRNLAFCVLKEIRTCSGHHVESITNTFSLKENQTQTENQSEDPIELVLNCRHVLELQRWEVVDVISMAGSRAKNVRNITIENLVRYMIRALPILFTEENMSEVTDVLIEQQIRRGIKNVALSYSIMSFFLAKFPRLEKKVHLIGSSQKFRIIEHSIPDVVLQEIKDGKRPSGNTKKAQAARYRSNKRLGKAAITKELKEDYLLVTDEIITKFKGGKRDDLADCLLQALVRTHPDIELIPEKVDSSFIEQDLEMEEIPDLEPIDAIFV